MPYNNKDKVIVDRAAIKRRRKMTNPKERKDLDFSNAARSRLRKNKGGKKR